MNSEVFKEKVEINENTLKVHVSCELRAYVGVHKKIYKESSLLNLIPEDLKDKVKLLSSPEKQVSNINKPQFSTSGTWVFTIIKEESKTPEKKPAPAKRNTRRKSTRSTGKRTATNKNNSWFFFKKMLE